MTSSGSSFLRQLSGGEGWKSTSRRWTSATDNALSRSSRGYYGGSGTERSLKQMEGLNTVMYGDGSGCGVVARKRVMVVVDQSSHSKHAMMWALTHVTNKGDLLTLLHITPPPPNKQSGSHHRCFDNSPNHLASSLASLCKASKPEVDVEALVIQGPKLATVKSQVKKLEVSVLVLGQKKPSPLLSCLCGSSSTENFVEQCINNVECLTIGVRKQREGIGGFLISTRWQKNFWLLA